MSLRRCSGISLTCFEPLQGRTSRKALVDKSVRSIRTMILALLITAASAASGEPIYGVARAGDGDSLTIGERRIRLFGIDAPEWNQSCKRDSRDWACGQAATEALSKLVTGKQVRCVPVDTDDHGRIVARCTVGGTDINRTMVATGHAVAYRRYSTEYVSAEEAAKGSRRGIWSGSFEAPSDVRHADDQVAPRRTRRSASGLVVPNVSISLQVSGCRIKGNRGSNGWIYHLPGMPYYAQTKAEEMFCSEAAAQSAGYRRAIVR